MSIDGCVYIVEKLQLEFFWRRKRGQLLLCNKHLFCSAGFGEREIRLTARTGEFTRKVERQRVAVQGDSPRKFICAEDVDGQKNNAIV